MSVASNTVRIVRKPAGQQLPVGTKFCISEPVAIDMGGIFQVQMAPKQQGHNRCQSCYFQEICPRFGDRIDDILPLCTFDDFTDVIFTRIQP